MLGIISATSTTFGLKLQKAATHEPVVGIWHKFLITTRKAITQRTTQISIPTLAIARKMSRVATVTMSLSYSAESKDTQ